VKKGIKLLTTYVSVMPEHIILMEFSRFATIRSTDGKNNLLASRGRSGPKGCAVAVEEKTSPRTLDNAKRTKV